MSAKQPDWTCLCGQDTSQGHNQDVHDSAVADMVAERDRLREIIANLYMERSLPPTPLRAAIRRAFGEAHRGH